MSGRAHGTIFFIHEKIFASILSTLHLVVLIGGDGGEDRFREGETQGSATNLLDTRSA